MATGVVMFVALAAGCSSDDPEDTFCDSADSLQANIVGLGDVDLIGEGTSAVTDQLGQIESDLDNLRESGADVVAEEVDALETAVEQLGSALRDLGEGISVEDAEGAIESISNVNSAAGAVIDKLATVCD
jgi:hypothetical protein